MRRGKVKVLVIVGTRPEFIKVAPVVRAFRADGCSECLLIATGQHLQLTDQILDAFELEPDVRLDIMVPGQSLSMLASRLLQRLDGLLDQQRPDLVLVQGDTTTTFCAAWAAFHRGIPVGHVEAGLRTGDLKAPWPEEANRQLASRLTTLHFAPTARARANLLREGIRQDSVFVTGNTVVDAVLHVREYLQHHPVQVPGLPADWRERWRSRPLVLVTGHRRESFGGGLEAVCEAIVRLAQRFPETVFIYPVHLNPKVREAVDAVLSSAAERLANILVIEPLGYLPFLALMEASTLLLTDSGGLQEEGPSLGKPVIVTRAVTERPEVVEAGAARLVGTDQELIVDTVAELLADEGRREAMKVPENPVGDGRAGPRIAAICRVFLAGGSMEAAQQAAAAI